MKRAIGALLWHSTDFADDADDADDNYQHWFCPSRTSSVWRWKRDEDEGTKKYKQTLSIPTWIHELLKPILTELGNDEVLITV